MQRARMAPPVIRHSSNPGPAQSEDSGQPASALDSALTVGHVVTAVRESSDHELGRISANDLSETEQSGLIWHRARRLAGPTAATELDQ